MLSGVESSHEIPVIIMARLSVALVSLRMERDGRKEREKGPKIDSYSMACSILTTCC